MDGDGNFNWRMVFPFDYMPIEKKIVVRKKVIGCFQIFSFISEERFSNGCRKIKTGVITATNHNGSKQRGEPIRIRSNYL